MADKAVISSYTWRTLDSQRAAYTGFPVFVLPDDLPQLFRKTARKTKDRLYVVSLAVIADNEKDFREFVSKAKASHIEIVSKEDECIFRPGDKIETLVKYWRDARRNGVSKIGAMRSGELKRKAADERAAGMTKDEWYSRSVTNAQLVEKYGCAIGTLRRIASERGWPRDRQHASIMAEIAHNRKERRNAKAN